MKWFRELERVGKERERKLKSEEELDVEISEAHPLAALYEVVSLYSSLDPAGSETPDVVPWSPSSCGLINKLR